VLARFFEGFPASRRQSTTIDDSGLAKDGEAEEKERRTTNHKSAKICG
jgi:hypothetical protein